MGTKSRPLRMQSAVEELGVQVRDDNKVWSLDHGVQGREQTALSLGNMESGRSAGSQRLGRPLPGEEERRDSGQGEQWWIKALLCNLNKKLQSGVWCG